VEDWQKWVDSNAEIPNAEKKCCVLPDQIILKNMWHAYTLDILHFSCTVYPLIDFGPVCHYIDA